MSEGVEKDSTGLSPRFIVPWIFVPREVRPTPQQRYFFEGTDLGPQNGSTIQSPLDLEIVLPNGKTPREVYGECNCVYGLAANGAGYLVPQPPKKRGGLTLGDVLALNRSRGLNCTECKIHPPSGRNGCPKYLRVEEKQLVSP